ncbi:MAG: HPr family phosphocarrier protein [Lachnospiraceae bacterium]|nr:HPr family phosphocarrier protein [Lachnospiraceae bacterium]
MKKINIAINPKEWDMFYVTKLVSHAGKCACNIDIISNKRYINMKSVIDMMAFREKIVYKKKLLICLDGIDEEEAAEWLIRYLGADSSVLNK